MSTFEEYLAIIEDSFLNFENKDPNTNPFTAPPLYKRKHFIYLNEVKGTRVFSGRLIQECANQITLIVKFTLKDEDQHFVVEAQYLCSDLNLYKTRVDYFRRLFLNEQI